MAPRQPMGKSLGFSRTGHFKTQNRPHLFDDFARELALLLPTSLSTMKLMCPFRPTIRSPVLGTGASQNYFPPRLPSCPDYDSDGFRSPSRISPACPVSLSSSTSSAPLPLPFFLRMLCTTLGPQDEKRQPPPSWWDPVMTSAMLLTSKPTSPLCCPVQQDQQDPLFRENQGAWPGGRPAHGCQGKSSFRGSFPGTGLGKRKK